MDTHIINNEKKRLEPIDESHCIFCGRELTQEDKKNFYVGVCKKTGRSTRGPIYQTIKIGAPRCNKCRNTHMKANALNILCVLLYACASFIAFLVLPYIIGLFCKYLGLSVVIMLASFLFLAFTWMYVTKKMYGIFLQIRNNYIKKRHTLTPEEGVSKYEITSSFLQEGFGFNKLEF